MKKRLIVGITGASGAVYGLTLLETLQSVSSIELHLIVSPTARQIFNDEIDAGAYEQAKSMAHYYHCIDNLAAPIASGSFLTEGMIIAPCSAKTLAAIAHGYGDNLMTRAADVVLKERRKLVILFRETPLHMVHIKNLAEVTSMGGIVLPPVPAFYHKPQTIADIIQHTIGKVMDLFNLPHSLYRRWEGR